MTQSPGAIGWICAALLALAALSLQYLGRRQAAQRGRRWWIAAVVVAALGSAGADCAPESSAAAVARALLGVWPLVALIGLRRFHARRLPFSGSADRCVLGIVMAVALLPLVDFGERWTGWPVLGAAAGALGALYAVRALQGATAGRAQAAWRLAQAGSALAVFASMPPALFLPGPAALSALQWQAIGAALGGLVTAFAVLSLSYERVERELRESRRRLRVLANTDTLTRLANRRHFHELATEALRVDAPGSAALLMFDIDHFKRINDVHGHACGDRALQLVAASVVANLRAPDLVGRYGGDEFALLLRGARLGDAMAVAERIVDHLQDEAARLPLPLAPSLSFGMVQVLAEESVDQALRRADQALYEAKRQGRGRAVSAHGDEALPVWGESRPIGLTPLYHS